MVGTTASPNFPTTPGALQQTYGGNEDAFVAKIDPTVSPSFAVSGFPSPSTAGVAGTFTVTAKDASGVTVANYTGTVHFRSSDAQATLPADYTFTAADAGVHTFSATLKTAGNQSITVTAKDAYGNTATGYTRTVHFTSSDPQAVLPANYAFTSADAGVHTFSATLKTAGIRSVTAADTITPSITGAETGIAVKPAPASRFVISAPASVSASMAFSLTVKVVDAYGNVVIGYTGTIRFTSSDGTATLPASYTFTAADNGVHTFTGLVLRKKGNQKITVTDTLNSSLTASVTESVL